MNIKHGIDIQTRVPIDSPFAKSKLKEAIVYFLDKYRPKITNPTIILCIGTDRSTGDSLGPLVGSNLLQFQSSYLRVYGHFINLGDL